ncbi:MAG: alkaline phosphatase [Caldimonas sp.]|uniref:alkaline phosphatase D family protein n=1 Tax=Caldimonas manganoxidans TaxID=196015 RepID=UPI0003610A49|nr:alkaline phosphatase D family protein [Caldimonas manganoxidans]GIX24654.1 MAG: alkaline phosphatase [Caldimonas sp.]
MPALPDRRAFLTQLSRTAAAVALARLAAPVAAQPDGARITDDPFTLGVASGMPRPEGVVLWTRLAPRPLEPDGGLPPVAMKLQWEVADDEHFRKVRQRGEVWTGPQRAHAVHVEVKGLPSGRTYHYRFHCAGASSPVGRTRTAPAEDAEVGLLRVALASCQHYEQGYFTVHREIARQDLDFVLFVGDYLYETSHPQRRLRRHGPRPITLADFRRQHAWYKLDPDLRAAHAAHPWVLTWDDHEVENDYAGDRSPLLPDPQAFLAVRAAAYQAYFEHLPLAPWMAPQGPHMRIHDRYPWGRLAELWTLDARQYRSPQACATAQRPLGGRLAAPCALLGDAQRSMLGGDQERWLHDGLSTCPRQWKLLGQSTQMSPWGVDTPWGRRLYTDGWDGYPAARERLLRGIAQARVRDVVVLGGDVHRHVAADLRVVPNDARSPVVASEFVTSSITSAGLPDYAMGLVRSSNPDLQHARSDERGYVLLSLDARHARAEFRATAHPVLADARLATQAVYVVAAGRAGVQAEHAAALARR